MRLEIIKHLRIYWMFKVLYDDLNAGFSLKRSRSIYFITVLPGQIGIGLDFLGIYQLADPWAPHAIRAVKT